MSNWFYLLQQTYLLDNCSKKKHNFDVFVLFAKGLGLYFIVHLVSEVRCEFLSLFFSPVRFLPLLPLSQWRSLNFAFVSSNVFHCLLDIKTLIIWGFYFVLSPLWIYWRLFINCRLLTHCLSAASCLCMMRCHGQSMRRHSSLLVLMNDRSNVLKDKYRVN